MKIGFDASQTGAGRAGCGWYARSLLEGLAAVDGANEYVLYPTFGDQFWSTNGGSDTFVPRQHNFRRGLRQRTLEAMQAFWRQPPRDWEERLGFPDVIHANNYFCPIGLRRARLVYTLYDLGFLTEPDWSSEANRIGCFAGVFAASLHADLIIAISEYSRTEFRRQFPHFPAQRIALAPPASRFANPGPSSRPDGLADVAAGEFWLHVGTIEPRKNIDHLFEALALVLRRDQRQRPLVLAGGHGWMMDHWRQRAESLGVSERVRAIGYVDDSALRWLYQNCFAFIFPSLYEGFGMPVLEAMSLGAPVIAAASSSIPEILGDAGILIDPSDPTSTAAAMLDLVEHPEKRPPMRERGIAAAARFSWLDSARRVIACYEKTLAEPRRPV